MSLILGKDGVQKLMVGYPTVSDKYDVGPGSVEGSNPINPGDVVMFGSAHGLYKPAAATITSMAQIAGIALATNVKVPTEYPSPAGPVPFQPGEAFGLLVRGFVAIALDADAVLADAKEGASVYLTSAGKATTVSTSNVLTPWKFMGVNELHGSVKVAEIVL